MRSLRNSARPALLFSLLLSFFSLSCQKEIPPTYKESDIPEAIKKICREEYSLQTTCFRTPTTLWIYAPMEQILHKEYGVNESKLFDSEMIDKLRNILTTIGRVLLSADQSPEFFALAATDTNVGIQYTIIGNVLDMKKSYAGALPWTETNRRYVLNLKVAPELIRDNEGVNFKPYDILFEEFLSEQIAQRSGAFFNQEEMNKSFKVEKSNGAFRENSIVIEYAITQIADPPRPLDIKKEILDIATYCIKSYEFFDFAMLELSDLVRQDKISLSNAAIWARTLKEW